MAKIYSRISTLEAILTNNSSLKNKMAKIIKAPVKRIEKYGVLNLELIFRKLTGKSLSLLIPKGYLDAVIIPALAVEIKAKNAPMLITIFKRSPPKTPEICQLLLHLLN